MMSLPDFEKKQLVFAFLNAGEKISFNNDNLVIKDRDGTLKLQTTCYRIFALCVVGCFTLTTGIIQRAHKFGFPIILMTASLKLYDKLGAKTAGNVLLRRKQYSYEGLDLAKHIIFNKIHNQSSVLESRRQKDESLKESIVKLSSYLEKIGPLGTEHLQELLSIEGNCARIYFKHQFDNCAWLGRKPRIKMDFINASLDIGYSLLFNFIEALLDVYGFDPYCGVLHKEFYMRKSLVCDLVEPFRIIIDTKIRKAVNLNQIKASDFSLVNHAYKLNWSVNKKYVSLFLSALLEFKNEIFLYVQSYYRAFMKGRPACEFPVFNWR